MSVWLLWCDLPWIYFRKFSFLILHHSRICCVVQSSEGFAFLLSAHISHINSDRNFFLFIARASRPPVSHDVFFCIPFRMCNVYHHTISYSNKLRAACLTSLSFNSFIHFTQCRWDSRSFATNDSFLVFFYYFFFFTSLVSSSRWIFLRSRNQWWRRWWDEIKRNCILGGSSSRVSDKF